MQFENLDQFKVIIWDFDGVILNSMDVRDSGFVEIFKDYPDWQVARLMDFHKSNGGLSRYVKIRFFFEEVLGTSITEEQVIEQANHFKKIMLANLINSDLILEDSLDFIKKHHEKKEFHVASGSDGKELNIICKQLGLSRFFKDINGSPMPKIEIVNKIIKDNGYPRHHCALIGDSINDYEAANENKITFFGYNNTKLKNIGDSGYIDSFKALAYD